MQPLQKNEKDIGVCLSIKCPHCHAENPFMLHQQAATYRLLGVPLFDFDRIYQLRCPQCTFRKDIDDRELRPAMEALKLFSRRERHELTAKEYEEALERLDFPSLQALRSAAKCWLCPGCAQEVPANFSECWQCAAPRPGLPAAPSTGPFEAPKFHSDITRPANPWE